MPNVANRTLKSKRMEAFAVALANNPNQTQAAIAAGYSVRRAKAQGCELAKRPEVIKRVAELAVTLSRRATKAMEVALKADDLNRKLVLAGIMETIEMAREQRKAADMLKGWELLGKTLGMWDPAPDDVHWDGDLSKLTDEQLHNLAKSLEKIADPAVVARAKRTLALETGEIIDVESTPAAPEGDQW